MSSQEHTAREDTSQPISDASEPAVTPPPALNMYWHLRWTIPLHIVLPIGLWWIMQMDGWLAAQAFIILHVVGLVFFVGTIKWWWRQSGDLIGLLFINHFVTFAVCVFLPW